MFIGEQSFCSGFFFWGGGGGGRPRISQKLLKKKKNHKENPLKHLIQFLQTISTSTFISSENS